jgi:hypothetical protein
MDDDKAQTLVIEDRKICVGEDEAQSCFVEAQRVLR